MPALRQVILFLTLILSTSAIALVSEVETSFAALVLDQLSSECLSCHEDIDEPKNKSHGGHITGIPYEKYTEDNQAFGLASVLPQELIFLEGKITCATCHGLDPHDGQILVIDNSGSALCHSCHKM